MGKLVLGVDPVDVSLEWNGNAIRVLIILVAENLTFGLNADDPEWNAVDHDVAPDRIGSREQLCRQGGADDRDSGAAALIILGQASAQVDGSIHPKSVVGPYAIDKSLLIGRRSRHRRPSRRTREK